MADINFTNYADYVDANNYGGLSNTYHMLQGNDTFYGSSARSTVWGDYGDDTIYGGSANEVLHGNAGRDYIYGGGGSDTIWAGGSNDQVDSTDARYDVVDLGDGNDTLYADGDKINARAGHDTVDLILGSNGISERADVTLGTGYDKLNITIHEHDYQNTNENRVDIRDFGINDTLTFSGHDYNWNWLDNGQVLDKLDVDNNGILNSRDTETYDNDDINVHVGQTYLELDIMDTNVFLHGMTAAKFDFLA